MMVTGDDDPSPEEATFMRALQWPLTHIRRMRLAAAYGDCTEDIAGALTTSLTRTDNQASLPRESGTSCDVGLYP